MRYPLAALLVSITVLAAGAPLHAQDDDAANRRWFIDVGYKPLRPIAVRNGTKQRIFWYVLLKLTNKTGQSRPFDLTARALTPQAKRQPIARPGLYPAVTEAIAKKHDIPGLENVLAVSGELGDGESKDIVIVFGSLSNLANKIDVRISGLTNTLYHEGQTVWREETELSIKFHRIGDEFDVTRNKIRDRGKSWVTLKRSKVRG